MILEIKFQQKCTMGMGQSHVPPSPQGDLGGAPGFLYPLLLLLNSMIHELNTSGDNSSRILC